MQIEFWETFSGSSPVVEGIQRQPAEVQSKVIWVMELFEDVGLALRWPHLKKLKGGLYLLRAKCFRILFVIRGGVAWFLHSFEGNGWAVPERHIRTTLQRAALIS